MSIDLPLTTPERADAFRRLGIWRDRTVAELFDESAARNSSKIAVVERNRTLTYAELKRLADNLTGNMARLGLEPGQIVAIQTKNAVEFPLMNIACSRLGLIFMPMHDGWRDAELQHLLGLARVPMLVIPGVYRDFDHAAMIREIRGNLPDLKHVFAIDGEHPGARAFSDLLGPATWTDADARAHRPDPDLPANVMLSGGTTSISKISPYSSNGFLAMLMSAAACADFNSEDVCAALAPAGTGATGYIFPILMPLLHGAKSVILDRWGDPAEAVELIRSNKCTYAVGVPTQLTRMIPAIEQHSPQDFAALRAFLCTGASLPFDTGVAVERMMECEILTMYGATDAGTVTMTALGDPLEARLRSVGRVRPGFECELRDPEGKKMAEGQRGEVCWRGPDKSWPYIGPRDQFEAVFDADGFYRSGDIGEFDANGFLYIVGRSKDMILRGARNIFPRTIEEQVILHPSVLDVSVAAMPDPELGERACAFVVLRPGKTLTFQEMIAFLKEKKLAIWQMPERLEIYDELPRGPGGKVQKVQLTADITRKLKQEAAGAA